MAKAVVVGGNGFLGSHVVDQLVEQGHSVRAFDRFGDHVNFSHVDEVECLTGDFLNREDLNSAVAGQDVVFHFLSTTTPATADTDPAEDLRSNVAGTIALLDACLAHDVNKVVFSSTGGAIYGPQGLPQYRETDPALPISPYGIGKLAIERYLDYYNRRFGLASLSLRISNPYGPRQHPQKPQGLIPIVLRRIAAGEPVTQIGDGSMVRDYIYVEDVARAVAPFAEKSSKHSLYNLGSGEGLAVSRVFATLREITGVDFAIDEVPQPASFVDSVVLDVSRYAEEFGSAATTSLESGLVQTWQSIKESA